MISDQCEFSVVLVCVLVVFLLSFFSCRIKRVRKRIVFPAGPSVREFEDFCVIPRRFHSENRTELKDRQIKEEGVRCRLDVKQITITQKIMTKIKSSEQKQREFVKRESWLIHLSLAFPCVCWLCALTRTGRTIAAFGDVFGVAAVDASGGCQSVFIVWIYLDMNAAVWGM